ncbi:MULTISPECIES: CPBP family intramembrane glutamic endopeptidase [Bacillales]|uniref:CPBP family intramembrane metalloprotease n=1 Tax=Brevibacillus aydinogluensis TaxID=927786 RepID=A0AA48MC61_9BACL|nr:MULTISPECIES: type II CAAX endopeptidase family protein [Bacillales]MBR8658596.1 CPBP family intramembrane metalloprotease [Brevibacillus sp. NL20B1]NNV02652.1 CPBP family intramembrane metalloprotease [Brevibacillus sp. MCWH]REK62265.1 MAG: CPBP family intramembrane metalloprotease [Brevibacillus sp.]MDT3415334.1 membrane protease YdiL (CAAX protease family) [Brevibacillus aydinogluensis]UFJ60423.1 CPBP family intramembrane metalloprotease [Anoxybacillus sediminis]
MKRRWEEFDPAALRLNLWLTQFIVLAVAAIGSLWVHGWKGTLLLFALPTLPELARAGAVALAVVLASILMDRYLPRRWQDDGDINERIFRGLPFGTTALLCAVIGIGEEWLFRGVLLPLIGNGWTSLVFTLVHVRYLQKPLLVASVYGTSWLLGWLFESGGQLVTPILAHMAIDLLLALYIQYGCASERRNQE